MHQGLPDYPLPTQGPDHQRQVWDPIRRRWVLLTPEEGVRQRLIRFLVEEKNIVPGLISVEREIRYFQTRRRFDIVVFSRQGTPFLLCECKAPDITLTESTLEQIARYNLVLQAPHLLVTNGHQRWFFSLGADGGYHDQPSGWYSQPGAPPETNG
ncbi:MAG: type I restriction enzyme HsdR N-terminal domain-containing protein [Bacteroidia bacterium]|nr:type I restriction enzyme HsdR N-terminal domain-containing protein [Bacteroidia bacterium]